MSRTKRFFYRLLQWTWGLPQTLVGALFFLLYRKQPHFVYQGAVVTRWRIRTGSLSLGMFIFLHPDWSENDPALLAHEYGHTIQSLLLGPLYLLVIGLPSVLWAGPSPLSGLRHAKKLPYSWLYTEKWADHNGKRYAKSLPLLPEQNNSGSQ